MLMSSAPPWGIQKYRTEKERGTVLLKQKWNLLPNAKGNAGAKATHVPCIHFPVGNYSKPLVAKQLHRD